MRWNAPEAFWLATVVLLVALGFLWRWRRRAALMRRQADEELMRRMSAATSLPAQVGRAALLLLALSCLIVAMARPQLGGAKVRSGHRGIDLVIALDISRSMLAQDIRPNRLTAARLALEAMLPRLSGSRIGLVAFSGVAFPQSPLTMDHSAIRMYLRGLHPELMPVGGTAIGRAIVEANELLTGRRKLSEAAKKGREIRPMHRAKTQVILLITDGEDHQSDPLGTASEAAQDGIRIYCAGLGTAAGEPIPIFDPEGSLLGYRKDRQGKVIYSRLDEATLRKLAEKSGGMYLPCTGERPLSQRLIEVLDGLDKEALGEGVRRHMDERYALPLVLALLLLALELLIGDRRRGRRASS